MQIMKWKIIIITGSIILSIFILSIGGYIFYVYSQMKQTANLVYKPLKTIKIDPLALTAPSANKHSSKSIHTDSTTTTKIPALKSINILILGVDQRPGDKGRSDTLMVATLNPNSHSMLLTSIPRDTRVKLPQNYNYSKNDAPYASRYSKINAAYAYGNETLTIQTVENYLNVPINYYVEMNMQGLSSLVEAVGGVTVKNSLDWYDEGYYKKGYHYKKGLIYLNGPKALGYVRMRHLDPNGDFGRNERQRQVVQAILDKGKSISSLTKITSILNAIGINVQTNLSFNDMKKLFSTYRQCRQNLASYEVKGTPKNVGGVSWVLVTNQEFQHVHNMIESVMYKKP